jgi:hypothetical protein
MIFSDIQLASQDLEAAFEYVAEAIVAFCYSGYLWN